VKLPLNLLTNIILFVTLFSDIKTRKEMKEMDIFDILNLIGGLCLFLFGMNIMGQALERRAGNKLRTLLGKLTTG